MRAESIHHLDLRVTKYRKSVSFYNRILRPLGFRTMGVRGEVVTYYLKGPTALGIRPVKKSFERNISYSYKRAGIHHVAISVETKNDVDKFYRLLRQNILEFSTLHRITLDTVEATTQSSSSTLMASTLKSSTGTYNIPERKDTTYNQRGI